VPVHPPSVPRVRVDSYPLQAAVTEELEPCDQCWMNDIPEFGSAAQLGPVSSGRSWAVKVFASHGV
jgi:hypothetical protein